MASSSFTGSSSQAVLGSRIPLERNFDQRATNRPGAISFCKSEFLRSVATGDCGAASRMITEAFEPELETGNKCALLACQQAPRRVLYNAGISFRRVARTMVDTNLILTSSGSNTWPKGLLLFGGRQENLPSSFCSGFFITPSSRFPSMTVAVYAAPSYAQPVYFF